MTTNQDLILRTLVYLHKQMTPDTHYWDKTTGGVYTTEIAKACGIGVDIVEKEADVLEGLKYIETMIREANVPYRGLRALQAGVDFIDAEDAAIKQAAADAQAVIDAQIQAQETQLDGLKTDLALALANWDTLKPEEQTASNKKVLEAFDLLNKLGKI